VVHILRPLGVALVLSYWKQRAWRGQGAAVAGGGSHGGKASTGSTPSLSPSRLSEQPELAAVSGQLHQVKNTGTGR
jgi:hypothetical protein